MRLLPLLLVLTTAAVLLFNVLRTPPPWTLDLGTGNDAPFVAGFRMPIQEGATHFRWSMPDAQLVVPAIAGKRLELRLHGDAVAVNHNHQLHLEQDGDTFATLEIQSGWRVYQVLLPEQPVGAAARGVIPLDLVSTAYRPGAPEERPPGVPLDWARLSPLQGVGAPVTLPLRGTLLLTWGLTLLAAPIDWLIRSLRPQTGDFSAVLWTSAIVSGVAGGLLLWAARDPFSLTWAWPAPPWVLFLGTLLLVTGKLQSRIARTWNLKPETWNPTQLALPGLWLPAHLALLLPLPVDLRGMAALFLLGLPGALPALLLFRHERDPLVRLLIGLCGGVALFPMLLLALQALPGAVTWWMLLLPCDALSVWLGWLLLRSPAPEPGQIVKPQRHAYLPLLAILLLGGVLRLTFLGGSEFQGDETRALLRTMGVVHGREEILLLHKKGPIEILLPAGPLALTGNLTEGIARLPFALAGMGVLLGSYLLGRALTADVQKHVPTGHLLDVQGTQVGLIAATILAVDGFLIGFARIVQYQSIVMLMMLSAFWCGWRFYAGAPHPQRYLIGAAVMSAIGLLAHYDGVFVLPVLAWLVIAGGRRRGWRGEQWFHGLWRPVLVGGGLLGSFYLPFVLHESFRKTTLTYLAWRLDPPAGTATQATSTLLFNNLNDFYGLATFYNTTFQMNWLALLLAAAGMLWLRQYMRPQFLRGVLPGILLAGCVLLVLAPERLVWAGVNWAGLFFALPLAGLLPAPATPAALRALLLWFGAAFLAEAFLIAEPRTHFYTMLVAAALLIGLAGAQILAWLQRQRLTGLRILVGLSGAAVLLPAVPYSYLAFVHRAPEYYRSFPTVHPGLYRAGYGDTLPTEHGYFGFPQRDGWPVIGALYQQGILQGDYDSNQKDVITTWYTRGTFRCKVTPDYFFAALREGEVDSHIQAKIWQGYELFGYVLVDGIRTLDIYSRTPVSQPPQAFALANYRSIANTPPIPNFPLQRTLLVDAPQYRLNADWQQAVQLRGYDLPQPQLAPGQSTWLTLYWEVLPAAEVKYAPFVELWDSSGTMVGSADPHCHTAPENWGLPYPTGTTFKLTADNALPAGTYTLRVGLRHTQTGALLPLESGAQTLQLAQLVITTSQL
ncbi:MAG: ArnT family glycosyltransferase [Chloroflexaceae bacterium]